MITTKSQSWNSILKYFESLLDHKWHIEPIIGLVQHIISAYSTRLFAFTSLDKLVISIYEDIDMKSEALHIKYDQELKTFLFSYFGGHSASRQPEWERIYDAESGIEKFDEFIKMINW